MFKKCLTRLEHQPEANQYKVYGNTAMYVCASGTAHSLPVDQLLLGSMSVKRSSASVTVNTYQQLGHGVLSRCYP